jgi:hypothetical protein
MAVSLGGSYVASGLVLYLDAGQSASYPGTGTTWYDLSPSGNNGTMFGGVTYSNGTMVFNGSSTSYVSVGSTGLSTFTSGVTVNVLANLYQSAGTYCRFVDFGNGNPANNIILYRNGTSNILSEYINASSTAYNVDIANTIQYGQNILYTFTADGTNWKAYINGVLINTTASSAKPDNITRTLNYIGKSNWATDGYYKGTMTAVQIYNRALTASEILQNYAYMSQGISFADGTVQSASGDSGSLIGVSTFVASGTWYKPAGCKSVVVKVVGGGGGATGYCESGGAGGYSEAQVDVSDVTSVSVTVGGGGAHTVYATASGSGGTSSFGSYCSATGGGGANSYINHSGGFGGVGSGGQINLQGGGGQGHVNSTGSWSGGRGGASYFGGSAGFIRNHGHLSASYLGKTFHGAPGAGGPGAQTDGATAGGQKGGYGENGIVIVYAYK